MFSKIPDELKKINNWCCYKLIWNEERKKNSKIPINSASGTPAKSNDPETWHSYEIALQAFEENDELDGLGFFFSSPYFGVDIDNQKDNTIVEEFINTLNTYCELSPSGQGVHLICRGQLPDGGRRKGDIEMYSHGRFFTMTGNMIGTASNINECTESIICLHSKYIGKKEKQKTQVISKTELCSSELLEIALQNIKVQKLYNGIWEDQYDSQSSADLALCNYLAFYLQGDFYDIDMAFSNSGLYRPKWDREDYKRNTIQNAIECCQKFYEPFQQKRFQITSNGKPTKKKYYSLDDTGNALRIFDTYHHLLRYSYVRKKWLVYKKFWKLDNGDQIKILVDSLLVDMGKEIESYKGNENVYKVHQKHLKRSRNSGGKVAMIEEAKHLLSIELEEFDKEEFLLNVNNCTIDLYNGEIREHSPKDYLTNLSSVEYDPGAICPNWSQFLEDTFLSDQELIAYIQKAVGYSFTSSTIEQCAFFLIGDGSNGKTVFMNVLSDIAGTYGRNMQVSTICQNKIMNSPRPDLARLNGARLVVAEEPSRGAQLDEGLLKQLTGSAKITARFLNENDFEYTPTFKMWVSMNYLPHIGGTDNGIWRRLHVIPFNNHVPDEKQDKKLQMKLKTEYSGILNWILQGFARYQQEGLKRPLSVEKTTNIYRDEMDTVNEFLETCTQKEAGASVGAKALYDVYVKWSENNGHTTHSNVRFGKELKIKGISRKRTGQGNFYTDIIMIKDDN